MPALEGESLRQALDLLLQALHAQLAAAQLQDLLPQAPVLGREVVAATEPLARRREPLRTRVHRARERTQAAQGCALEKTSRSPAVGLLRGDQEKLTDQQDGEEQSNAARAHGGWMRFTVSISGSIPF
jgi:hypothetical protein